MGIVAKEVKAMSQADILEFEECGEVTFSGHCLKLTDIKVLILVFSTLLPLFSIFFLIVDIACRIAFCQLE